MKTTFLSPKRDMPFAAHRLPKIPSISGDRLTRTLECAEALRKRLKGLLEGRVFYYPEDPVHRDKDPETRSRQVVAVILPPLKAGFGNIFRSGAWSVVDDLGRHARLDWITPLAGKPAIAIEPLFKEGFAPVSDLYDMYRSDRTRPRFSQAELARFDEEDHRRKVLEANELRVRIATAVESLKVERSSASADRKRPSTVATDVPVSRSARSVDRAEVLEQRRLRQQVIRLQKLKKF